MVVSLRQNRPGRARPRTCRGSASIREVCLLGMSPRRDWSEGDRVAWSGRSYRVEAIGPRAGEGTEPGATYAHLAPAPA
jgi:hypothetical protein